MLNFSKIKIALIYLIFSFVAIFSLSNFNNFNYIFFDKKVNLGLDLQGGSYLLLEVDSTSLEKRKLQSKVIPLKKKMRENLIEFNNFNIKNKNIQFNLNDKDIKKFSTFFLNRNNNDINLYLNDYNSFELDFKTSNNKVDIYLSKYGIINLRTAAVEQSIEIVRRRIDEVVQKSHLY